MVKGRSPKGESFPPSKLNPRPVPSFLRTTVLGEPRGTSTNFKSTKKIVKKNCHSLKVTNIYYLTKGIYCLVDFQGFWEVVHYSSSCMKGNRCGHRSLPRAGWRIGCGTVPWLPYYPDVEPEKNIYIFFSNFLLIFFKFPYLEDAQSFSVSNSFSRFAVDGQYAITFLYSTITVGQCARNDFVHLKEVELFLPWCTNLSH